MTQEILEIPIYNPYRIPAMVADALVIAMSGGMLVVFILCHWPVATLGFGIAGSVASCLCLFSWLMNVGKGYKQWKDRDPDNHLRIRWNLTQKAVWLASTLFKDVCTVLFLVFALGSLGVITLGALFPVFISAAVIIGMIGTLVLDNKLKLQFFE
jgi:hypothetical protein